MEYNSGIRVLNNWEIVDELGEGSCGKVFRIKKVQNNVTFEAALKVIRIPKSASDVKALLFDGMDEKTVASYFKDYADRLIQEIAIMVALKGHSNVVSCEDYALIAHEGKIGWDILMQMELLTPFPEYQMEHHMEEEEVIKLAKDICVALGYCHRQHGLIHRDVKPSNLFVDKSGHFKLGDFGVSRIIEGSIGNFSRQGTDMYMAPEVYKNQPYGETVDIYSLGIMLYHMMNNKRFPFYPQTAQIPGFAEREEAFIRRMNGEILPAPVNASRAFSDIILRACAYESGERYSSAGQMLEELKRLDHTLYFQRSISVESTVGKNVDSKIVDDKSHMSPIIVADTSDDEKTSYIFNTKFDKKTEDSPEPQGVASQKDMMQSQDVMRKEFSNAQEITLDSIKEDNPVFLLDRQTEQLQKPKAYKLTSMLCVVVAAIAVIAGVMIGLVLFAQNLDESTLMMSKLTGQENKNMGLKGYTTVVFFGGDFYDSMLEKYGYYGYADTITIMAINNETKEIRMESVYRDPQQPNSLWTKINQSYSVDGSTGAINTLNKSLDLDIKDYIDINCDVLSDIIDLLGGLEVEITGEEAEELNRYMEGTGRMVGDAGIYNLDGSQAVVYAHQLTKGFEYYDNHRLVIQKILEKVADADALTLNRILDNVYPKISTNVSLKELVGFATIMTEYTIGENKGFQRETEDVETKGESVVMPEDFEKSVKELHKFLYGEENYIPSEEVHIVSEEIQSSSELDGEGGTYME